MASGCSMTFHLSYKAGDPRSQCFVSSSRKPGGHSRKTRLCGSRTMHMQLRIKYQHVLFANMKGASYGHTCISVDMCFQGFGLAQPKGKASICAARQSFFGLFLA
jgi:hypothetical protein